MPTTRGRAKHSDSQKIPQGSLTVGAAQGRKRDGRTDKTSASTSQKETKDLTQSAHYRLWGPGFLDVSLFPEEQDPSTPTQAPAQAMDYVGMNLSTLTIPHADDLQKLIESLQGLSASRQESPSPTRQPPVQTPTTAEEEENRLELMGAGQLPVTEKAHTRPPPTHNPVSTQTRARELAKRPLPAAPSCNVC